MFQNWFLRDQDKKEQPTQSVRGRTTSCSIPLLWILLLVALGPWLWNLIQEGLENRVEIDYYPTFREELASGNVEKITVSGDQVQGELKEASEIQIPDTNELTKYSKFTTFLPSFGDNELFSLLQRQDVHVKTLPEQDFSIWTIMLNIMPLILLMGVGYILFQRMQGQGEQIISMGKSKARLYKREREATTFDDIAGAQGAKRELNEIIEFLKNPEDFQRLGGEIPKGVLLVGPPGTGKTLLARAVAGEAEVPFFNITGSDFMEMFVGVGASRVRDLFQEAKKAAPSIIFIDELDSIGRRRGAGLGGGHDEREQTLNQMLSELDGFEPKENVIVMAATNRPDILDPALLRPGRFDRRITVDLPTMRDRLEILNIHSRDKPLADDLDLENIARGTPGFSGADLENLLNEAALIAARREKDVIEEDDIEDARDKVILGLKRENLALTDEECRTLAYHEAGHAVVAAILPNADPIHKVTIVPRGRAMGVTQQLPDRDRYLYSREYMVDRLAVMMGGRAAEDLVLKTATSGAENDLKQATQLVRKMVLDWGMSSKFKHIAFGGRRDQVFLGEQIAQRREYSESTAREVDEEIKLILEEAFNRAKRTIRENLDGLNNVVDALLDREEIPGSEVQNLIGSNNKER